MLRNTLVSTSHVLRFTGSIVKTNKLIQLAKTTPLSTPRYGLSQNFYTTPQRHLHPMVLLVLRPITKAASIISGKVFRNWWKNLSPDRKKLYKKKYLLNPRFWAIPIGVVTVAGGIFYVAHLETTPITNRQRFVLFNTKQMELMSQLQVDQQLEEFKDAIVDPKTKVYARVWKIIERLVKSNDDIDQVKSQNWTLHVVDHKVENAFVLPNGHIFVFTGLLTITGNDDQLAFILGHEMAHSILSHGAEKLSFAGIINMITALSLAMIWAVLPDVFATIAQYVQSKLSDVLVGLPYSRSLELEADVVGLHLISKACFDVRESSIFWRNWAVISEMKSKDEPIEFLSSHPTHMNRANELEKLIPQAITKRKECKCPDLMGSPSKLDLVLLKSLIEKSQANDQSTNLKQDV